MLPEPAGKDAMRYTYFTPAIQRLIGCLKAINSAAAAIGGTVTSK